MGSERVHEHWSVEIRRQRSGRAEGAARRRWVSHIVLWLRQVKNPGPTWSAQTHISLVHPDHHDLLVCTGTGVLGVRTVGQRPAGPSNPHHEAFEVVAFCRPVAPDARDAGCCQCLARNDELFCVAYQAHLPPSSSRGIVNGKSLTQRQMMSIFC